MVLAMVAAGSFRGSPSAEINTIRHRLAASSSRLRKIYVALRGRHQFWCYFKLCTLFPKTFSTESKISPITPIVIPSHHINWILYTVTKAIQNCDCNQNFSKWLNELRCRKCPVDWSPATLTALDGLNVRKTTATRSEQTGDCFESEVKSSWDSLRWQRQCSDRN